MPKRKPASNADAKPKQPRPGVIAAEELYTLQEFQQRSGLGFVPKQIPYLRLG